MEISRRTKIAALIMLITAAAVLGALMFTANANNEVTSTSTATSSICLPPRKEGMGWLSNLTAEQRAELKAMNEEFRKAIQAKLDEWNVQITPGSRANLTAEQRTELQKMRQKYQEAVKAKLEEWGVKLPEFKGPKRWLGNLTDAQRAELKTMIEEFQSAVQTKLKEWGVEAPALPNPNRSRGFGPMQPRRGGPGPRGFPMP